jgi:hypothetical protein
MTRGSDKPPPGFKKANFIGAVGWKLMIVFATKSCSEGPERIILAFKITAGDIVEEQSRGIGRWARFKEFLFNLCLLAS